MKRLYFIFVLVALLWSNKSFAYDIEVNGFYYNILSATTLEVTYGDIKYTGDVTIPSTVSYNGKTYNVISVGTKAFAKCDKLLSIYMGNHIKSIGNKAFYKCSSLKNYYFSNCELGTYVFAYCTSLINGDINGNIPEGTFYGCTSIESLSPKYRSIGKKAYEGCSSIKGNVEIVGSAYDVIIYDSAFADCIGITKVSLKANVKMELDAFAGCSSLETVYATNNDSGSNYTYVSGFGHAFGKCKKLKNIDIKNFGKRIFCENGSIYAKSDWGYYLNFVIPDKSVYITPDWLPYIDIYSFSSIGKLRRVILSANLKSIDFNAFYNCPGLKEIYCYSKTPISIHDQLYETNISADFNPALTGKLKLYVPKGCKQNYSNTRPWGKFIIEEFDVANFDPNAEYEEIEEVDGIKYKLTYDMEVEVAHKDDYSGDIVIPENVSINDKEYKVTSIEKNAFYSNSNGGCKITSIQIPSSVTSIGSFAFSYCELLESVKMPDDIACLDSCTFSGCISLESIALPRKLQEIKYAAFSDGSGLKSIEIPNQVFRIGGFAFQRNKFLKTVITSNGLKEIYYYAFSHCESLQTIVLGENVEKIGCNAFEWCSQLSRIYSLNPTPPALNQRFDNGGSVWSKYITFGNTFDWGVNQDATLYVPIGSKEAYQNDGQWGKFKNIVEFDPNTLDPSTLGINIIKNNEEEMKRYSLDGRILSTPSKGFNIIKMKDGTIKKVLVK